MIDSDLQTGPTEKILPSIFHELAKLGHDKKSIFNHVGIDYKASGDELSLSASQQSTVFNYACCLLASETGSRNHKDFVKKTVTDMLLYCVITCKDLAEVIERTTVYCGLVESIGISIELIQQGPLVELRVDIGRDTLDIPSLLLTSAAMSTFYHLFSWITATNLKLSEVGLRYENVGVGMPLGALQGQPLRYRQANNYFIFPAAYLKLPVARTYQQLTQVIDYFPVNLVLASSGDMSFSSRVREIIHSSLSGNLPPMSLDVAAQLINTSSVTLRRRLRDEGSSFSQILTGCQQTEAERLLRSQMPIKTIAVQLGFSDDRAFRRAFKRWSGQTPTDYRGQHRG